MRWVGLVLVLCTAVRADEGDDKLAEAYKAFAMDRGSRGRDALRKFLKEHESHRRRAEATLALALAYDVSDRTIGRRLKWLDKVIEEWPESQEAGRAKTFRREVLRLQAERAPRGATLPRDARPGDLVRAKRKGGGSSEFRIYWLDSGKLLPRLLELPFKELAAARLESDAFKPFRTLVGAFDADFNWGSAYIRGNFARAGPYVFEESTSYGTKASHVVNFQRANLYMKTLGGEMVGYALRPTTLHIRTVKGTRKHVVDGMFRLPVNEDAWVFARTGLALDAFRVHPNQRPDQSRVHIATDRPIYRPGQTVSYRAVLRDLKGGKLVLPPQAKVRVEIRDPSGRILRSNQASWSRRGTLTGSFQLAPEPPLGDYSVLVHVPRPDDEDEWLWWREDDAPPVWFRRFSVHAYRKPEVSVRTELLPGAKKGTLRGRFVATYFHGGPVADAEVHWSAESDFYAPLPDEHALIPGPHEAWRHAFDEADDDDDWWGGDGAGDGRGKTNADGVLEFEFADIEAATRFHIFAELVDASEKATEVRATLERPVAAVKLAVATDRAWYEPGQSVSAEVRVFDNEERPVANRKFTLTAFLDDWEDEFDGWESFFEKELVSDADGRATCRVPLKRGGQLRLRARAYDDAGRLVVHRAHYYVRHETEDDGVDVETDRIVYTPGQEAHVLLLAPRGTMGILTVESDRFHDARLVHFKDKTSETLKIPIRPEWAPSVVVKLVGLTGDECDSGGREIFVFPEGRAFDVAIAADKASYRPREKARITIRTPGAAELEVGIVDASVLDLMGDDTPDLRPFFYPRRSPFASAYGSYDKISDDWSTSRKFATGEDSEVPLFGGQAEEAEASEAEPVSPFEAAGGAVRRFFPDTLFWSGTVVTGEDGTATLDLTMPDSLTRWRVVARAVSGADRFGVGKSALLTRQNVVARLAAPRFLVEGDECDVGVIVHNHLDAAMVFTVGLDGYGAPRTVKVAAGGEARENWRVKPQREGVLKLKGFAVSGAESDAMELEIPVRTRQVETRLHRSGVDALEWDLDPPAPARLEVFAAGSVDAAIRQALPYLARYPYGCVEQTMSRFLPAVVATKALARGNDRLKEELPQLVDAGLQRLYAFQHEDGGWGWWKDDETDPFMTAYVVFGLATAKQAGYAVDPGTLQDGLDALRGFKPFPLAVYARTLLGNDVDEADEPRHARGAAFLALAGRDVKLPATPSKEGGPAAVRNAGLVLRALAVRKPGDPRINLFTDWLLRRRKGPAWHSTLDSAYAVFGLSAVPAAAPPGQPVRADLDGRPLALSDGRAAAGVAAKGKLTVRGEGRHITAVLRYRGASEPITSTHFALERTFERLEGEKWVALKDGARVKAGERLRVTAKLEAKARAEYLMVTIPLPAGFEARQPDEDDAWWGDVSVRDDRIEIAVADLVGKASVSLPVWVVARGTFHVRAAEAFAMYEPDRTVRGKTLSLRIG
ncbi:MAG: alpha-2-macroglobulin family protein [Planctomycetota bacterium]|jgi:hypothetical protein